MLRVALGVDGRLAAAAGGGSIGAVGRGWPGAGMTETTGSVMQQSVVEGVGNAGARNRAARNGAEGEQGM